MILLSNSSPKPSAKISVSAIPIPLIHVSSSSGDSDTSSITLESVQSISGKNEYHILLKKLSFEREPLWNDHKVINSLHSVRSYQKGSLKRLLI